MSREKLIAVSNQIILNLTNNELCDFVNRYQCVLQDFLNSCPNLVKFHIFKYLDFIDMKCLFKTCKQMYELTINDKYNNIWFTAIKVLLGNNEDAFVYEIPYGYRHKEAIYWNIDNIQRIQKEYNARWFDIYFFLKWFQVFTSNGLGTPTMRQLTPEQNMLMMYGCFKMRMYKLYNNNILDESHKRYVLSNSLSKLVGIEYGCMISKEELSDRLVEKFGTYKLTNKNRISEYLNITPELSQIILDNKGFTFKIPERITPKKIVNMLNGSLFNLSQWPFTRIMDTKLEQELIERGVRDTIY